ncbi:S1 family peptidase [Streptomyces sp. AJS327]|nr:S1 family peptidase [Streptomyces sp. AJS327]MBA0051667.1 S1 family peptidase [Streptomyces sp. AJS327]
MKSSAFRRRTLTACAATLAAGGLVLAGFTGSANADQNGASDRTGTAASDLSPGLLDAMQQDLGLTSAEAKTRLANESSAAKTAERLEKALGDRFAGARVSGQTADRLTVSTTSAADARRISAAGATAQVVEHGLAELNGVKKQLDRAAEKNSPRGVPSWYVDTRENRVVVEASGTRAAQAFLDEAGLTTKDVTVRESDLKPRTFANIRGGDAYYMGGGRCSVGFSVSGSGGTGFVTAGHCGTVGTSTTGYNQQAQGTFRGSTFPGRDYAWVETNSSWTPTPTVNGYGNGDVRVSGSTEAVEGASICRSGSTTGWHCGSVQLRNTSVTYPQGTVNGVTRTNVCAEPGDSGGSFISGSQAQGMTSGGSGNCSSGGTTFFQPVNPALQAYGLSLTTG